MAVITGKFMLSLSGSTRKMENIITSYTANKMVFCIVSKKQQENIIIFVVVISLTT